MGELRFEYLVVGVSALVSYLCLFCLLQIGKVRTEILLQLKDLEARLRADLGPKE